MVSQKIMIFADKMSFRRVGESTKNWVEVPSEQILSQCIDAMKNGEIECLTLYGVKDERLFVIGKPDFYHITIFIDESEGFGYNDGSGNSTKIEIAGDYWPAFTVCKDIDILRSIAHNFFISGVPAKSAYWLHFSDDE